MKLFLLSIFFPLALSVTIFAEANTPSERKVMKAIREDAPKPVKAYMDSLRSLDKHFAPFSKIPFDPDEQPKKARAAKYKITKVDISIKPSANGIDFDWRFSISYGPLSGRGAEGHLSQQHGYWIISKIKQWVS